MNRTIAIALCVVAILANLAAILINAPLGNPLWILNLLAVMALCTTLGYVIAC